MSENQQPVVNQQQENVVYGRSAFLVQTTDQGVSVLPVLIDVDNKVRHYPGHPAIFPNLQYALAQIEELKGLVIKHFEERNQNLPQSPKLVENSEDKAKKTYKLGEDAS